MQAKGIDTLVVLNEAHMCYLTGYEGYSDYVPQAAILRAGDADPVLIFREMDIHCAYPTVYLDKSRIECYPESYIGTAARSPWEVIGKRIVEIAQSGWIGIEAGAKGFSHRDYERLIHAVGGQKVEDGTSVVPSVTIKKSASEIKYMQDAARIVDRALTAGANKIAAGVRECEVAATVMQHLAEGTAETGGGPGVPVTMPVTPWSQAPHLKWTDRRYEKQRQTNFEIGAFVHRYCCPLSRTVYLGTPPDRYKHVHETVLAGFTAGLAAVKPGAQAGDIHRAFMKAFKPGGVRRNRVSAIRSASTGATAASVFKTTTRLSWNRTSRSISSSAFGNGRLLYPERGHPCDAERRRDLHEGLARYDRTLGSIVMRSKQNMEATMNTKLIPLHRQTKSILFVVAAAVLLIVGLHTAAQSQSTLDQIKKDGFATIAIASEPPLMVLNSDGTPGGLGPDIDRAILDRMGVKNAKGEVMEYGAMISALQARRVSLASSGGLYIRPERCKSVLFAEPIACTSEGFILPVALVGKVKSSRILLRRVCAWGSAQDARNRRWR